MDPSALHSQIGRILETMPNLGPGGIGTQTVQLWLGRAYALVEAAGNALDVIEFRGAVDTLGNGALNIGARMRISTCLHRAMARAELEMPIDQQGAFLPVGEAFTALMQVSKVVSKARSDVLFVDPYADAALLERFCVLTPTGAENRILMDKRNLHASLRVAARCWRDQYESARPLEIRTSPKGRLHDRLIIVDGTDVWNVSQSFNALANRSPASIIRLPSEIAIMKIDSYGSIWDESAEMATSVEQ